MNALAIVLLAIANEQEPPQLFPEVELPVQCVAGACIMPAQVARDLMEAHNFHVQKIRELEKRLAVLSEAKGCAKVEVTEPPKFNFRKEHDL